MTDDLVPREAIGRYTDDHGTIEDICESVMAMVRSDGERSSRFGL